MEPNAAKILKFYNPELISLDDRIILLEKLSEELTSLTELMAQEYLKLRAELSVIRLGILFVGFLATLYISYVKKEDYEAGLRGIKSVIKMGYLVGYDYYQSYQENNYQFAAIDISQKTSQEQKYHFAWLKAFSKWVEKIALAKQIQAKVGFIEETSYRQLVDIENSVKTIKEKEFSYIIERMYEEDFLSHLSETIKMAFILEQTTVFVGLYYGFHHYPVDQLDVIMQQVKERYELLKGMNKNPLH
ncbi:MAG TPA: hypothetical protein VHZ76_02120 [Gammaproteobacteria bacterium]|jgi:hypothetical protein|nr:hypothetical protein [Gammaproteobacteria bacterium]